MEDSCDKESDGFLKTVFRIRANIKEFREMSAEKLKGIQKKYLRGLAHNLNPVVYIGKRGVTDTLVESFKEALNTHELIKVKFIDLKEKDKKREIISMLKVKIGCELVGVKGHTAIFFRRNRDPKKQRVKIPEK